jgi:hypothetical protein
MALEEFLEPEVAIAVAVTAAVSSPKVRRTVRNVLVRGLAMVLEAKDAFVHELKGLHTTDSPATEIVGEGVGEATAAAATEAVKEAI